MESPSWFQSAIQRQLDHVSAQIEQHPELHKCRAEENLAFDTLFSGMDKKRSPEFMDWEDKLHFKLAMEKERLYLQGLKDGVQLLVTLLGDSISSVDVLLAKAKTEPDPVKPD